MTKQSPKTTNKRRQNPWYKNQVSSLDGRHTRLADKVRALKAFANSTEVALQETQQELAFVLKTVLIQGQLLIELRELIEGRNPSTSSSGMSTAESKVE